MFRSSDRRCSVTKGVLRNFSKFTGKHLCQPQACNVIKKETLVQMFSCEFCEISKNTICYRTPSTCSFIKNETLAQVFSSTFCEISKNTFCYRTFPVADSVCCRRKVAAVKIKKLKAFIIKHYDISKTYSVQFHLYYSVNLSYFYFLIHGFQSSILHKLRNTLNC